MLFRVPQSAYIYLFQPVDRVLARSFKIYYFGSSSPIEKFLYEALAFERVLARVFGNKLCFFVSHYRHNFYVAQ